MTDQQKVRDAFPRYAAYRHLRAYGAWPSGVPDWAKNHEGSMDDVTLRNAVIDELAQAALSHASSATVKENLTVGESLAEWLEREMPAGTVIGDPRWWAKRIAGRVHQLYTHPAPSAEDARDAARYRWLRNIDHEDWPAVRVPCPCPDNIKHCRTKHTAPKRGDALDKAIDQALAAERGEGK